MSEAARTTADGRGVVGNASKRCNAGAVTRLVGNASRRCNAGAVTRLVGNASKRCNAGTVTRLVGNASKRCNAGAVTRLVGNASKRCNAGAVTLGSVTYYAEDSYGAGIGSDLNGSCKAKRWAAPGAAAATAGTTRNKQTESVSGSYDKSHGHS